ncbi:foldase protein PrsA [Solirubrobacter pauli]|uniref:Foldase protein PrsA n=1 Tax=Solirubrobacter pauli TaxID=166793 RepID=A0A660LBT0_9ACTN|nr:peptidyl-prolyl cis-trans isomerase [Solirubrobacter pauli]RKQ91685.1 foldase protein PrsA [Solirubrobacter pauli]
MKQLLPLTAAGLVLAACGGVPGNSVATVDGDPIKKADYEHWMTVVRKLSPDLKREQARDQVMNLLASLRWFDGEAERMDIALGDAEVTKAFSEQKRQSFPKDADYRTFLKTSGQTEADIRQRVRAALLATKIQERVVKGADKVPERAVADFYARNRARFSQPEKRDLRVVLTQKRGAAERARAALERGDSWKAVTKRYSIDDTSKASGGKLPAQAEGTLDAELDKAVFSARKGALAGPVKTQYGYYVFTVTAVVAPTQQTLAEARPAIRQTLVGERQQKALSTFMADFAKRWRARTQCAEDYRTSDCDNGPKPTATPTPRMQ